MHKKSRFDPAWRLGTKAQERNPAQKILSRLVTLDFYVLPEFSREHFPNSGYIFPAVGFLQFHFNAEINGFFNQYHGLVQTGSQSIHISGHIYHLPLNIITGITRHALRYFLVQQVFAPLKLSFGEYILQVFRHP